MLDVISEMEAKSRVYLDFNATTGLSADVQSAVPTFLQEFGNPSSIHWASRAPKTVLRETRQEIAKQLGCHPLEIVFNSGGSESNNTVIKSVFDLVAKTSLRNEFITSQVEHPSVINTFRYLESLGAIVHYIPVSRNGQLDLEFLVQHLSEKTALVSVMLANNETGTVFPIKAIAAQAHKVGALFHCDAVQALGKVAINLKELDVDYASFSAHKFYSLKGTGFVFVKRNSPYESLIHGGGQERQRRGGTENTLGIFALGVQARRLPQTIEKTEVMSELRDYLELRILRDIPGATVTAKNGPRLPNTSSLVIPGVDGETLLMSLDLKGYAVSTGAACSSGNPEPSPVLLNMGLSREEAQSSLRISLGWETTFQEVESFLLTLQKTVAHLRTLSTNGASYDLSP
ncbi:MAG: cysteine desulfurase family protein [Bdellovibrio sp.]